MGPVELRLFAGEDAAAQERLVAAPALSSSSMEAA